MLRVTTIHASTAAPSARYYTRYLAEDGPDGDGVWLGRQARDLGLEGRVSTEDLEAVLSGIDPKTGAQLGAALVDRVDGKGRLIRAVAGFDATFSAPKSVSVWWGLTGDVGVLEAHQTAVQAVVDHLERHGATTRVRVNGQRAHPDTRGLIVAAFGQATSREDDPQLHTHVVISAKVQTDDGRWWALDARYLKRKQRALGGLYQSVLRAELTHRYGIAWTDIANGQAEIAGMPRELLEAFSKRTRRVDDLLAAKILTFQETQGREPTRWERAALCREAAADSRDPKTGTGAEKLSERWADEARALGWTPDRLLHAMRTAAREAPTVAPGVRVVDVVEALSTKGSTWTRADVLQAVCDLAPAVSHLAGSEWARTLDHACDQVIAACVTLDPSTTGPVRAGDGRSIWIAPSEPHLTHPDVLAQEERILAFSATRGDPATSSATVDRAGLDALQADVAAAVAGNARLVLVVGPAGTGKTTALARAATDLRFHHRPAFGVAPTAKAAKVLRDETGLAADTLAKLLHEWRTAQPADRYRLPREATVIVDEAGMVGTQALDELCRLAVSQEWRLVLVGDPRQLHAVGRGGMFDELCRTGSPLELATIHRFRNAWEHQASLKLRVGNTAALDAYVAHDRVTAGDFDRVADTIAKKWLEETARQRTVAVVAETNEHVDALNAAIQQARRDAGELGRETVRVAGGETAAVGDTIVTRRNQRSLTTDRTEPVRNRDRWTVSAVHGDGSLTVSHASGHGTVRLPADYAREHVRLGYAATAHGHQGDTVDVSLAVITEATTHRSLYVAATRGRDENHLHVVAENADVERAREVLEQVLTNDRVDIPATAQRRNLADQAPRAEQSRAVVSAAQERADALRAYRDAVARAKPVMDALDRARREAELARHAHAAARAELDQAPIWRRRSVRQALADADNVMAHASQQLNAAAEHAEPYRAAVHEAQERVSELDRAATTERIRDRLRNLELRAAERAAGRDLGIEPPGLGR